MEEEQQLLNNEKDTISVFVDSKIAWEWQKLDSYARDLKMPTPVPTDPIESWNIPTPKIKLARIKAPNDLEWLQKYAEGGVDGTEEK